MQSFTQSSFWKAYRKLPEQVRQQARESYRLFEEDPRHPSLQFKRVSQRRPVYSARVNIDYRAAGVRDGDAIVWFWIGPHHEYDRMLRNVKEWGQRPHDVRSTHRPLIPCVSSS